MLLKRSLAVASAISAALIFGALAADAVSGISDGGHKAGAYSPVEPISSGPHTAQGRATTASPTNGDETPSADPSLTAATGAPYATGSNARSNSINSGSARTPIGNGSPATSNGGEAAESLAPGSGAPTTTSSSVDDHGGDDAADPPLDDD